MTSKYFKIIYKFLITGFLISLIFPVSVFSENQDSDSIFISEINFRGSLSQTRCIEPDKLQDYQKNTNWCGRDQWLEITNPGSQNIDLVGWSVEFRGGKTLDLSILSQINSQTSLVLGFTQQNFVSVLPVKNLVSYNLLYLSSESDKNPDNHNITAILKNQSLIVDQINTHPSQLDSDYLNTRGKSFTKCQKSDSWQKSTILFDEQNFGTPGYLDSSCPKPIVAEVSQPITNPNQEILNQIKPPQQANQPQIQEVLVPQKAIEQVAVAPNPEVTNQVQTSQLTALKSEQIQVDLPSYLEKTEVKIQSKIFTEQKATKFEYLNQNHSSLLKAEYQNVFTTSSNEQILLLNLLTLTGLFFNLTKKLFTSVKFKPSFNLQKI